MEIYHLHAQHLAIYHKNEYINPVAADQLENNISGNSRMFVVEYNLKETATNYFWKAGNCNKTN